jgi:hypothetical protein
MTDPKDIDDAIRQAGVETGSWQDVRTGSRKEPETIRRQKELLVKLSVLLEEQIRRDQATVADLHERFNRLKYGGGV